MSTPYWGQLPPSKARRMSGDFDNADRRQSLDQSTSQPQSQYQSQPQPQSRSNRASVQTTHTDARTESTFSPLESPAASNFQGNGLAPRPPSLPYGQNQYAPELQERRRKRTSRNQADDSPHDEIITAASPPPPPAAPDVPRAPPVSYRDPYRHSSPAFTPTYTYNADGQPGPPLSAYRFGSPRFSSPGLGSPRFGSPQARMAGMESDHYYKDATPEAERQFRAPILDRNRQNFDENGGTGGQLDRDSERSGSIRRAANEDPADPSLPKRQGTLSAPSKRPTWADDRSPLQKLELTLDSITKEEKRARVEAAEHRARERAARKEKALLQEKLQPHSQAQVQPLPQSERSNGQQVRFRDRRQPQDQYEESRAVVADPNQAQPSAAAFQSSLSRNSLEEDKPPSQSPPPRIPVAKNQNVTNSEKSGLPQRNLSFRERAAKNDINLPKDGDSNSPPSPVTPPSGGFAISRSGSNKLKKNPPGDPWYAARRDAEEKSAAYQRRSLPAEKPSEPYRDFGATTATIKPRNETLPGAPPSQFSDRPPARGKQFNQEDYYEEPPTKQRGFATTTGFGPGDPIGNNQYPPPSQPTYQPSVQDEEVLPAPTRSTVKSVKFPDEYDEYDSDGTPHEFGIHDYMHRGKLKPGRGMYQPPSYLDEWKKATVGTLGGALLDLKEEPVQTGDKNTPWWENHGRRRSSTTTRPPQLDAFNAVYDETKGPTRFKPALYLKCGPLLRYCGIRHEKPLARVSQNDASLDKEIWRGTVMIVTQDSESSYDIPPILRLFVQPIELLPPPPAELRGEQVLPPEYVDPIAGIPKLGRRGETLYVRPVEHLEEAKDVSRLDPDDGLFEITRTAPDPPGSFASRKRRTPVDGEKLGKYKDVRGFRLHAERGHTFWRFNIEVELGSTQQRIAYRINHGPATGFWVPARGQSMNIMFHSCNGFSLSVNSDEFSGPDPMWRDVLNNHQTRPFHVMIGGGDQIYNDAIMRDTKHFQNWLQIKNPLHKNNAPFTHEMQNEMEHFYLERYMMWFSQGLFGLANCQIPMVNMYDDHDIIDGFGSYPHHFMKSPVFSGLGNVAFKYYMLFQHQSIPDETEDTEPSWALGVKLGPYIQEQSRSLFMSLGSKIALLAVDCRTERTRDEVVREDTWKKLTERCYEDIVKGETQHLLVLLGVPIAYPRLVWLENILTSRLMDPIKALGKTGMLGNFLNRFDGGVEVLDDLDDHWTAKNHKNERRFTIEDLQDIAGDKSVRVTILSGDVHLAAVGQFYSNPKQNLAKHKDFRYMPNIISSAIVNTPPPDLMADILNKRNKVHHFDKETEEDMIPIFTNGVDGKPRNNKHLLPHRNWCSIREYVPGQTPPPTPPPEEYEITPEGTPPGSRRGSILRRFSLSKKRGPSVRPDASHDPADRSRPPLSGGSFMRSFSRRASSDGGSRPNKLLRTLSLGRADSSRPRGNLFGRRNSTDRPDDGGINGDWGADSGDEDYDGVHEAPPARQQSSRPTVYAQTAPSYGHSTSNGKLTKPPPRSRGNDEYEVGDDAFFTARPPKRAVTQPMRNEYENYYDPASSDENAPPTRPFHRTPTGLTTKQLKKKGVAHHEVDLEGGLDVCLNVEVNAKDPAGITVPYRLLVPRLWYEYQGEDMESDEPEPEPEMTSANQHHDQQYERDQQRYEYEHDQRYEHEQMQDPDQEQAPIMYEGAYADVGEDERPPKQGVLKRLFSGRRRNTSGGNGGGGSQYRARRQSP
ncbi:uncharacterized protein F4822DRAFT_425979 [Hypoxylon trugodes]|uniref:uncharacterized protein n=1 Tax=Hypoxylon trugodes TaxID=326681 RepID=UPI00219D4D60|nr:uncharacterized protein F4822DRAFT_425979 [Hypoxylon trugodes]KAI1392772.1 hypothetical protein F4822DRAFT_425979 [Hypoxylon trugodes]